MNTIKNGSITFLIFKKKSERRYTGVCLDFGIVIQDKDEYSLKCELEKAALGYLKSVAKGKMNESLLNNQAEDEYFNIYNKILASEQNRFIQKTNKSSFTDEFKEINWNLMPIRNITQTCNA